MTELPPQTARSDATPESITDPTTLLDREDVEHVQDAIEYDDEELFERIATLTGTAVVGVTNDDGATLLTVDEVEQTFVLPYAAVDQGDDYVDAVVENVEDHAGLTIRLDDVRVVREIEHTLAAEGGRTHTTYDLLFEASPAPDATVDDDAPLRTLYCGEPVEDEDQRTDWFHDLPEFGEEMCDTVVRDARRFLD